MRRHFFNDEEEGFFKTEKRKGAAKNPMSGTLSIRCDFESGCIYPVFGYIQNQMAKIKMFLIKLIHNLYMNVKMTYLRYLFLSQHAFYFPWHH